MSRHHAVHQALEQLAYLQRALRQAEDPAQLQPLAEANRVSGRNLLHFLALQQHAPADLQPMLHTLGLRGIASGNIAASVARAIDWLSTPQFDPDPLDDHAGLRLRRAEHLFGARRGCARTMVTLPDNAARSPDLLDALLLQDMAVARINCAKGNAAQWHDNAVAVQNAAERTGKPCKRSFELAGPKLRIGDITPRAAVVKWKPERNDAGLILNPVQVQFYITGETAPAKADFAVPIDEAILREAQAGDTLRVKDVRGKRRDLHIGALKERVLICEAEDTAYVSPGTPVQLRRGAHVICRGHVGDLPQRPGYVALAPGDTLVLMHGSTRGQPAVRRPDGSMAAAILSCALEDVFVHVQRGQRIRFDDGKVEGVIEQADAHRLDIRITQAEGGRVKLKGGRGINLPDTQLPLTALTEADTVALAEVLPDADLLAVSFVQTPVDVEQIVELLAQHDASHVGLILKLETASVVRQLPQVLLAALRHPHVAVMIARGDLAAEMGFAALAATQQHILQLCEVAHLPVIWATQVLETMAKKGVPSRAEVSDVVLAGQADCVMLNKGPYIVETLRFLDDLLARNVQTTPSA